MRTCTNKIFQNFAAFYSNSNTFASWYELIQSFWVTMVKAWRSDKKNKCLS